MGIEEESVVVVIAVIGLPAELPGSWSASGVAANHKSARSLLISTTTGAATFRSMGFPSPIAGVNIGVVPAEEPK